MSTHAMLVSLLATAAAGAQPDALKDVVQPDWSLVQGDDAARFSYEDLEYSSDDWYGSTFWTGPDWTRVGRDWQHSGNLVNSVRVFNAPKPGKAQVTGRCYKADVKCGDGVALAIRHNAKTVWSAQIDFADTTGVEFDLEVDLAPGDRLRFALANGGEISCDTTYWDPAITYADGEVHRASEGFGEETGVWSYEMETDEG
ncbi:MAG TPA: hypothetical protein QGH10_16910, partial [Armatimonadota bacterium]|nr:hypothetical protein [Armatimonadota bacterium]